MHVLNINWCLGEKGRSCSWIAAGTTHLWSLESGRLSLSSLWSLTLPEWSWKPNMRISEIHPRGFQKWPLEQTQKWENTLSHLRGVLSRGLRPVTLTCCDYGVGLGGMVKRKSLSKANIDWVNSIGKSLGNCPVSFSQCLGWGESHRLDTYAECICINSKKTSSTHWPVFPKKSFWRSNRYRSVHVTSLIGEKP